MYKQIYTIPFKSIEENSYNIIIEKKGFTGSSEELTGASSPFVVEVDLESPLKPFRLSTATLSIYGGDYLQSLFTPDPQGVRVKLLKNGSVEWLGFITNDTYSQDYSNIEFVYEIELVNPISSLKHIKYKVEDRNISFIELIKEAIQESNSEFKTLYLPSSYTNELSQNIYNLIKVSSDNFADEQEETMSYYEILEEIAKYLGLTITIKNDEIYFIDYIGIGKGFNGYYKYDLVTDTTTRETLYHTETIQSLDYVSDSSTLQINSGRNKAKVTCSLFDIGNMLPEFDDEKSTFISMEENGSTVGKVKYKEIIRYYSTEKFDMFQYSSGSDSGEINNGKLTGGYLGSHFIRSAEYDAENIPSRLNFQNELLIHRYGMINGELNNSKPIIKFTSEKSITTHTNMYFCLALDIKMNYVLFEKNVAKELIKIADKDTTMEMYAKIKIGNKYWNGADWTTTESRFTMPITVKKGNQFNEVYLALDNTNTFDKGVGDLEGYTFKSSDEIIRGKIELTLYTFDGYRKLFPFGTVGDRFMRMRNIELRYGIPNAQTVYGDYLDEDKKNDIVYENDIDEIYVDEANEINLKICTYPDDYFKLCYSTTFIGNKYLKTLKYNPLGITDKPEVVLINKVLDYYKEPKYEVSIPVSNKLLYPYSIITDKNLPNKRFIYAGSEIDYEYEKNTINILEI